ncbi:hypothetical protein EC957_006676 [Mortierella hygrophila]|uniref:Uncharacterized protein n=1 Tax=Mortierella hygrophila TaxID=979708 RepID=A0A9P6JZ15_9FUNG|nr:hypothetical protein EC957_006676 [Mortierella hygrophila]
MSTALRFHLYLEELVLTGELDVDALFDNVCQGEDEDVGEDKDEHESEDEDEHESEDEREDEDEDEGEDENDAFGFYHEPGPEEEQEIEVENDDVEDDDMADNGDIRPPLFRGPFIPGERFNLLLVDDEESKEQLRFYKNDIIDIVIALRLPDLIVTQSRDKVWSVEALCLVLFRFASPSKLSRKSSVFHRSSATISRVINCTLFWIMEHWHKVLDWDTLRLTPAKLEEYAHRCNLKPAAYVAMFSASLMELAVLFVGHVLDKKDSTIAARSSTP